jgi:DNA replication and repair protein RecF
VLTGRNGAGKTNLLEAVSYLVPGRGLRRARLSEVTYSRGGAADTGWAVAARVRTSFGAVDLGTGLEQPSVPGGREQRVVQIDGEPVKSQASLAEHMSLHWLTPQMDRLFVEGPSARRRFLDRLVFGRDPAHAGRVSAYEQAMRERARLLGESSTPDPAWLSALEDTMAARGVAVAAARRELALHLDAACHEGFGPFPGATIAVAGELEGWLAEGPALECEDRFRAVLAENRRHDTDRGRATVGPHRGDLLVRHLPKDQPADVCSTGEQKALLIALVLGNAKMRAAEEGVVPVLLLDEIAAHLDAERRQALFDMITSLNAQTWLAGTDRDVFEPLAGAAQFFHIEDAIVTPEQ